MLVYPAKERQRRSNRTDPTRADILTGGSVQVLGESIYYQASGNAEDGPTILFLHESGGSSATWHGQLTGLAQGARCIVPDLPGHGKSEGVGYVRISEYRKAVLGFLDALAIRWPVFLAGVCLGAAVAADIALHAPERVAGLILAGASDRGRVGENLLRAEPLGEAGTGEFVHGLFGHTPSPRLVNQCLKHWRATSSLVRSGDLSALYAYSLTASLAAIAHPALLVAGAEDPIASPAVTERLALQTPAARVVAIPRAGCLSMIEQPAAFNKAVAGFLAELNTGCPIGPEVRQRGGYRRF